MRSTNAVMKAIKASQACAGVSKRWPGSTVAASSAYSFSAALRLKFSTGTSTKALLRP
ncbi:hypothetical protein D3C77_693250 [compost metagenome]